MLVSSEKRRSVLLLVLSQTLVLGLWFSSSAVIADMASEAGLATGDLAFLATAVQIGFVVGALGFAVLGVADRFEPRLVLLIATLAAAAANAALLALPIGSNAAALARGLTGAALAGVYPVGMKIAVGWGQKDRGFLVGVLVAALTVGSASPHLIALFGGADWRLTIATTTVLAVLGALAVLAVRLGPYHQKAAAFEAKAVMLAWTDRRIRLAIAGYLGHMWELYSFWAWVGVVASASYAVRMEPMAAADLAKLTAFLAISLGGLACAPAGMLADRVGKARAAQWAMMGSGAAALASAAAYGGPVWLVMGLLLLWGLTVIPDSAQFSALVADAAPADRAGTLMTLQTALGFALSAVTVQGAPLLAAAIGWPLTLTCLALGPAVGIEAMRRLIRS